MPHTRDPLNETINTIQIDEDQITEIVWFKSSIVKILLFILGTILLCSIVLILLATALTHTSWFIRKRRSIHKRLDLSNRSKLEIKDYILYYFCFAVEALAINSVNDSETLLKNTKFFGNRQSEKSYEPTSLPLRFQPEKLYGTTTILQKDKSRKGSCINLPFHPPENQFRKKSMLDSFVFSDQRRCSKLLDSSSLSKSNLSIHHSHLAGSEKNSSELIKPVIDSKSEPRDIPQNFPGLSNQSSFDKNSSRKASVSTDDTKCYAPNEGDICLAVPIITRRASATDYELLDNRSDKSKRPIDAPISITVTDTQAELDGNLTLKNVDMYTLSAPGLFVEDQRFTRRNSFLSYSTPVVVKGKEDREPTDDDKHFHPSAEIRNRIENSSSFFGGLQTDESILLNTDTDKQKIINKRLPPVITYDWMKFPAGIMAIGVKYFPHVSSNQDQILVTLYTGKNLLSPRLWHKTIFCVYCTISTKENSQTFTVHSKETEFGCPQFSNHNEISMNLPVRRCSILTGAHDIEAPKIHIKLKIFESIPKWSGDKEYYHGSCSMSTEELSKNQKGFEHIGWCLVEEAYPAIRLSGDMLISICRNQSKEFVNIRLHEIRNLQFLSYGRWRIENLNGLLSNRSYEMTVHTCLINAGHIIKSIKATTIHYPFRRNSKHNETDVNNSTENKLYESKTTETKSNNFTLADCFVHFSLPTVKKSVGRHLAVKHGITIYIKGKLPISDLIPYECLNQLKQMGITSTRVLNAIGECHFGDYGFQSDLIKDFNRPPSCHFSQGFSFWNDAGSRNGTRIYQWLRIE
ncbi:unnamed protein product [Schistosoma rodhaini]|uniref:TMEM132D_N domain-containing protein n=1 Tax=Schistosoma rodhaini TaxID=6188 RepID=A0A183QJM4_9TREM|nr:unnamed protein product [Schistosoma rodhaini]